MLAQDVSLFPSRCPIKVQLKAVRFYPSRLPTGGYALSIQCKGRNLSVWLRRRSFRFAPRTAGMLARDMEDGWISDIIQISRYIVHSVGSHKPQFCYT